MADVQIILREGKGYLVGAPPEVEEPLREATSFKPAGYQYDGRYKHGKWDGTIKLLSGGKFPAGLVDEITGVLDKSEIPYQLHTDAATANKPDLSMALVGIESRWYQDEAVEAALLSQRGVIRAPTGSGKTAMGARIIYARGKRAIVIVPTIDLLYQYKEFLEAHLIVDDGTRGHIGQLGDQVVDPQPVTVATARTMAKALNVAYNPPPMEYDDKDDTVVKPGALKEWVEAIGTIIVDEVQVLGAQEVYDITNKIPAPNKYGLSASPWRDDGADLQITAATGPVLYRIGTDVLVRDGFLVPPIIQVVPTRGMWTPGAYGQTCTKCHEQRGRKKPPQWGYVDRCENCGSTRFRSEYQDAYKKEIVDNGVRNMLVVQKTMAAPGPRLVLVKLVRHGRILEQMIHGSRFLSGKNAGAERVEAYAAMRRGEIHTIIATTIADMGLDLPILRTLVLAGGGKSSVRHLQRIGRVARPYEDKKSATVIDFDDSHVHKWFREHEAARRKIEKAEWGKTAIWL